MSFWVDFKELCQWEDLNGKREFGDLLASTTYCSPSGHLEVASLDSHLDTPTKRHSWFEWRESKYWVRRCNQVLIPQVFTVLDIDPKQGESAQQLHERITKTINDLMKENFDFVAWRANKGAHIWIFLPYMATLSRGEAEKVRRYLIFKFQADHMKISLRSMIAFPNERHWKSGINMQVIAVNG